MLDAGASGKRQLPEVGSALCPGQYEHKSFTAQLSDRMVSKRGPYDLFTGDRNKPSVVADDDITIELEEDWVSCWYGLFAPTDAAGVESIDDDGMVEGDTTVWEEDIDGAGMQDEEGADTEEEDAFTLVRTKSRSWSLALRISDISLCWEEDATL